MSSLNQNYWIDGLPNHWDKRKLKFVARVKLSNIDKKTHDGEVSVRLCNYVDVYYNDRITSKIPFMLATASEAQINALAIDEGDVLITKDSEAADDIAVSALVSENLPGVVCGYHLAHIRARKELLNGSFLNRAFGAVGIKEQFIVAANGVTRYGLGDPNIKDALFPLPPLTEQQTIAHYLDHKTALIDKYITNKKKQIELLEKLRSSIISEAVTKGLSSDVEMENSGVEWLEILPKHWRVVRLGLVSQVTNGCTPSKNRSDYWTGSDVPWLASGKVNDGVVEKANEWITKKALAECSLRLLPAGTIIVGMIGQGKTRGMSAQLDIEATINQNLAAITTKKDINGKFLLYVLKHSYKPLREAGRGGQQDALNCDLVAGFKIPFPPLREQIGIVEHLDKKTCDIDRSIRQVIKQISNIESYRTSLIS